MNNSTPDMTPPDPIAPGEVAPTEASPLPGIGIGKALGIVLLTQLLPLPFLGIVKLAGLDEGGWGGSTILATGAFLALIFAGRRWRVHAGFDRASWIASRPHLPWVAGGTVGQLSLILGLFGLIATYSKPFDQALRDVDLPIKGPMPILVLFGVLLFPLGEEIVFRGTILRHMLRRYSVRKAMIACAAIFAIVHIYPVKLPATFLFGLCLGWLYWRTGSLVLSGAAHVFNNGTAFLFTPGEKPATYAMPLHASIPMILAGAALMAYVFVRLDRALPRPDCAEREPLPQPPPELPVQ